MKEETKCRSCGETGLTELMSLGRLPLANALLTAADLAEPEGTYPLTLVFCSHCSLVQTVEMIPPEKLFREYPYFSSFSDTTLDEARTLALRVIDTQRLNGASLVIEVGSNDGYLLQYYKQATIPVLGIEPAANVARSAESEREVPTLYEFFSAALAEQLREQSRRADVIHVNNVLAHLPDLNGAVRGLSRLLKAGGTVIVEVPYVKEMIDGCYFDTIYHEHLSYFSLTALERLFTRHGLIIYDVERLAIHGGTLRVFACAESDGTRFRSRAVSGLLGQEDEWGVRKPDYYLTLGAKVAALREELVTLLRELKSQGRRIAVYGASAKGSTLLNYFRIGAETVDYVVDRSTFKQGHYTPGTHLPIYPPEKLAEDLPEYTLLLTWNFADEILKQQAEYRRRGGKFIIPVPELRVI